MAEKGNAAELSPSQAVDHYRSAVNADPNNADDYMQLGAAHYIAHHWDDAITAFEKAVSLNPNLGHAHYYLGVLYAAKGDKAAAERELNAVLRASTNPILIAQAKARIPAVTGPMQLATQSES